VRTILIFNRGLFVDFFFFFLLKFFDKFLLIQKRKLMYISSQILLNGKVNDHFNWVFCAHRYFSWGFLHHLSTMQYSIYLFMIIIGSRLFRWLPIHYGCPSLIGVFLQMLILGLIQADLYLISDEILSLSLYYLYLFN